MLRFLLPFWLVEPLSVLAGLFANLIFKRSRFGVERRVRGLLSASKFGTHGLAIDRHIQIEGPLDMAEGVTLYGGSHYVSSSDNPVRIGAKSHIGRNSVLSGLGGISIGSGCAVSSGVLIYSISNQIGTPPELPIIDQPPLKDAVKVGNDVWIGAGAIILPGVTVSDHAVIGAGSLVNRDVPAWQIVGGVPAKIIRDRREPKS
jgi:acetyltransferase-like isoleucine patch superfamily enzyme